MRSGSLSAFFMAGVVTGFFIRSGSTIANDCATLSFAETFCMIAELFMMVTFPSLISWVPVVIHS